MIELFGWGGTISISFWKQSTNSNALWCRVSYCILTWEVVFYTHFWSSVEVKEDREVLHWTSSIGMCVVWWRKYPGLVHKFQQQLNILEKDQHNGTLLHERYSMFRSCLSHSLLSNACMILLPKSTLFTHFCYICNFLDTPYSICDTFFLNLWKLTKL